MLFPNRVFKDDFLTMGIWNLHSRLIFVLSTEPEKVSSAVCQRKKSKESPSWGGGLGKGWGQVCDPRSEKHKGILDRSTPEAG